MANIVKIGILIDAVDKGGAKVNKFAQRAARDWRSVGLAIGGAAIAAGAGILRLTRSIADAGDAIAKNSAELALSTDAYQELTFAAELAGLSTDQFRVSMRSLGKAVGESAQGNKEYAKALKTLGVEIRDSNGDLRLTDAIFEDVAQRFSQLRNDGNKTAIAMRLFGRAGARMANLLNQGAEGIRAAREEARQLGIVISERTLRQTERLQDSLLKLRRAARGAAAVLVADLVPGLAKAAEEGAKAVGGGRGIFSASGLKEIAKAATFIVKTLAVLGRSFDLFGLGVSVVMSTTGEAFGVLLNKLISFAETNLPRLQRVLLEAFSELPDDIQTQFATPARALLLGLGENLEGLSDPAKQFAQDLKTGGQAARQEFNQALLDIFRLDESFQRIIRSFDEVPQGAREAGDGTDELARKTANLTAQQRLFLAGLRNTEVEALRAQRERTAQLEGAHRAALENDAIRAEQERLHMEQQRAQLERNMAVFERFSGVISSGFSSAIFSGKKFSDVLADIGKRAASLALEMALSGIFSFLGKAALGALGFLVGGPAGAAVGVAAGAAAGVATSSAGLTAGPITQPTPVNPPIATGASGLAPAGDTFVIAPTTSFPLDRGRMDQIVRDDLLPSTRRLAEIRRRSR